MMKLDKNFKLYIPEMDNNNKSYPKTKESILKLLSVYFGGATAYKATGYWSDKGVLYEDRMNVVQVNYTNETLTFDRVKVLVDCINKIFKVYSQEAVSLEINGTLNILDKNDNIKDIIGLF